MTGKRFDHRAYKQKLEQALKDAILQRDVELVLMARKQLDQYREVRRG